MTHNSPIPGQVTVIVPQQELAHLRRAGLDGLPRSKHVQLDFSDAGYLLKVRPAGLKPRAIAFLESKARRYLKKAGAL